MIKIVRFHAASAAVLLATLATALPTATQPSQTSHKPILACKHKRPHRARCLYCPPCNREWGRVHHWHPAPTATSSTSETPSSYGEWAIPAMIVKCESGFKNEPPNSSGAAGYYQINDWYGKGGHGAPNANEHSKSEQGEMARKLVRESGYQPWIESSGCSGYS